MPSGYEWLIVLGVIALLFGGAKLPKLARSLGSAKGEFEKGLKEGDKAAKAADAAPAAVVAPVVVETPAPATPVVEAPAAAADDNLSHEAKIADAHARAAEAEATAARAKAEAARLAAEAPKSDA